MIRPFLPSLPPKSPRVAFVDAAFLCPSPSMSRHCLYLFGAVLSYIIIPLYERFDLGIKSVGFIGC